LAAFAGPGVGLTGRLQRIKGKKGKRMERDFKRGEWANWGIVFSGISTYRKIGKVYLTPGRSEWGKVYKSWGESGQVLGGQPTLATQQAKPRLNIHGNDDRGRYLQDKPTAIS